MRSVRSEQGTYSRRSLLNSYLLDQWLPAKAASLSYLRQTLSGLDRLTFTVSDGVNDSSPAESDRYRGCPSFCHSLRGRHPKQAVKFIRAKLVASKMASSLLARQGQVVTYILTVDGTGLPLSQTAPITVTDLLPVGLTFSGGLCASSRGTPPVCSAQNIYWRGTLSTTAASVMISYTAQVTTSLPVTLTNRMQVDAASDGIYTRTVTLVTNPPQVYLPLIIKEGE